jgi:hypothetical protein
LEWGDIKELKKIKHDLLGHWLAGRGIHQMDNERGILFLWTRQIPPHYNIGYCGLQVQISINVR